MNEAALSVVTLVPRRGDNGERDRLWNFARTWWENDHPDWPIFEGVEDRTGPFNRSKAINDAARQAGEWDAAVIIDADVICNPHAVAVGVQRAVEGGYVVVTHNERVMLSKAGTAKILDGYRGPWKERGMVERSWTDSVSCCVVVPRDVWDTVGGFDENFKGWGFEDTAFVVAAEFLTGKPLGFVQSECFHLHHARQPDARLNSPTYRANEARKKKYLAAAASAEPDAMQLLLAEARPLPSTAVSPLAATRIPRIFHRTVPAETSAEVEAWWAKFEELHPGWELRTCREPIDPDDWPLTGHLFGRCANGAQKAGLIRLEALVVHGGVYVDSDVEPFRPFDSLLQLPAFAAWEDETTIPDAVLGAEPNHPAFVAALEKACAVIEGGGDAWQSGPGVTTEVLAGRDDVLVLPPGAFFPAHYLEKNKLGSRTAAPWVFAEHKWQHSWGTPAQRASIDKRQRA